jgi:F0F1-type ATP synthase membrane subunit c/vacuolar-type H+-ATPase subunit K
MDEIEREKIDNMINEHHQKQAMYCEEHFLTADRAFKAFWAFLVIGLGLVGTGVGWALTESNTVSKQQVTVEAMSKEIASLQSIHTTMDTVVTLIRQIRSAQK